jgi:hypothetical protein
MSFFKIRSHELFAQGWLQTTILLISASLARITGWATGMGSAVFLCIVVMCPQSQGKVFQEE